ncbi:hypothetical protein [Chryseobacterium indoltheticum]|uniref:Uncharacterized protein n=1 Tax=Chryseobacterium indoltheticum TaxID=254 RepID=A0A381FHP3_9FLAO|nr:hypothetical protein [Chryseobacterium indoltheticum]SUX46060.1 Uncharacterised protein [Chryseobacterium indoltheticum]
MNVLSLNKFKIQSAFIKSLFVVDLEDNGATTLKINEKLFFEKLRAFLPFFDSEKDVSNLKQSESLSIYHKSNQCPSEPEILIKLLWFEAEENGRIKYFIKLQF